MLVSSVSKLLKSHGPNAQYVVPSRLKPQSSSATIAAEADPHDSIKPVAAAHSSFLIIVRPPLSGNKPRALTRVSDMGVSKLCATTQIKIISY